VVDDDIILEKDGKEILIPKKNGAVGGIFLKRDKDGNFLQPEAIFVNSLGQEPITMPLKTLYVGEELYEFDTGLDAGIFVYPSVIDSGNGEIRINELGALFYLSERVVHSQVAELYLFGKESPYFELVHSEENQLISNLKSQGVGIRDFVQYQGLQGPIKIWEIKYPSTVESNSEFLETKYPNEELNRAKPGEY